MLHLFRPRSELQALKQLSASLPISAKGAASRGAANWVEVQREWTSREQKAVQNDTRIAELERELKAHGCCWRKPTPVRALRKRVSIWLTASEGLWDMEVVAGDPVNPRNRFWWSPQFRRLLGFETVEEFPDVLDSWASRLHPEDKAYSLEA